MSIFGVLVLSIFFPAINSECLLMSGSDCLSCEGFWDPITNCSTCIGDNWDIESGCTKCVNQSHYSVSSNCTLCEINWDTTSQCTSCLGNWNISTHCQTCKNRYTNDNNDDCGFCPDNFESENSECSDCSNFWSGANCDICEGNYDPENNCSKCKGNYDPAYGCTRCIQNYDFSLQCLTCLKNFNISTGCTRCYKGYTLSKGKCEIIRKERLVSVQIIIVVVVCATLMAICLLIVLAYSLTKAALDVGLFSQKKFNLVGNIREESVELVRKQQGIDGVDTSSTSLTGEDEDEERKGKFGNMSVSFEKKKLSPSDKERDLKNSYKLVPGNWRSVPRQKKFKRKNKNLLLGSSRDPYKRVKKRKAVKTFPFRIDAFIPIDSFMNDYEIRPLRKTPIQKCEKSEEPEKKVEPILKLLEESGENEENESESEQNLSVSPIYSAESDTEANSLVVADRKKKKFDWKKVHLKFSPKKKKR